MKKMTNITNKDKEILLSKSAYALPDNPSSKQFSASQIKRKMYEPSLVLLEWLQRVIDESNENNDVLEEKFNDVNKSLHDKLEATTKSVIVDELPEVGQGNILYFLKGKTTGEPYAVYFWNGEDYCYLGNVSGDFASREEVEGLRGEVTNVFKVVKNISQLPIENDNRIYVVAENNNWYYWDGNAYVSGG